MWRQKLKEGGKTAFLTNYWPCVGVALILALLGGVGSAGTGNATAQYNVQYQQTPGYMIGSSSFVSAVSPFLLFMVLGFVVAAFLLEVLVINPMEVGGKRFYLDNRTQQGQMGQLLYAFQEGRYGNTVKTLLCRDVFLILWSLLFIIPGIIKSYEYRMVPYLLAEHPDMDRREVFAKSKELMDGSKWDTFVLDFSFIGWELLAAFTVGLLDIFFVSPYRMATDAELYVNLRDGDGYTS